MTFHLITSSPSSALLVDRAVIPRDEVQSLYDATALLARAEARLAEVDRMREAGRAAGHAVGHEEGHAGGLAKAQAETAEAMTRMHLDLEAERARLRESTGRLALDVVRRIAAEIGPEATLAALAERAVRDMLPAEPITVRVAPSNAGAVSARLWPIGAAIEVTGDDAIDADDCVIETTAGRTHAGLEIQLAALAKVFGGTAR